MKVGDVIVCYNIRADGGTIKEITIGNKYIFYNKYTVVINHTAYYVLADIRNMDGTFVYMNTRVTSLDRFFKVFDEIEEEVL